MSVAQLRCTNCSAPLDPSRGASQRCDYCGVTLVIAGAAGEPAPVAGITLLEVGPDKVAVVRVVRKHTKLDLMGAKELVDRAPCVVGEKLDASQLQALVRDLREVGAKAR